MPRAGVRTVAPPACLSRAQPCINDLAPPQEERRATGRTGIPHHHGIVPEGVGAPEAPRRSECRPAKQTTQQRGVKRPRRGQRSDAVWAVAFDILLLEGGDLAGAIAFCDRAGLSAETASAALTARFWDAPVALLVADAEVASQDGVAIPREARRFRRDFHLHSCVSRLNQNLGHAPSYDQIFRQRVDDDAVEPRQPRTVAAAHRKTQRQWARRFQRGWHGHVGIIRTQDGGSSAEALAMVKEGPTRTPLPPPPPTHTRQPLRQPQGRPSQTPRVADSGTRGHRFREPVEPDFGTSGTRFR